MLNSTGRVQCKSAVTAGVQPECWTVQVQCGIHELVQLTYTQDAVLYRYGIVHRYWYSRCTARPESWKMHYILEAFFMCSKRYKALHFGNLRNLSSTKARASFNSLMPTGGGTLGREMKEPASIWE
jgi:hypothetical protein